MKLSRSAIVVSILLSFSLAACSSSKSATDASGAPAKSKEEIKAEKIKAKEEAIAKKYPPAPAGSALAKVTTGMSEADVREILGPPTTQQTSQTGKRWIPGYGAFAPDQEKTEFIYRGVGSVYFSKNQYNGRLTVHHVVSDPAK